MTEKEFEAAYDEDVRAEWVGGEVIIMSPASRQHVDLVGFLNAILRLFSSHHDLGAIYGPELQVRFASPPRRRIPDILFVTKERLEIIKANYVEGPPDLVVEIVSPDSLARDWREKYLEYESAAVREYWVIDPMAERVEVYTLDDENKYALIVAEDGIIRSKVLDGFYLDVTWLWQDPLPNPLEILKKLAVL
jgi:Uma2 family endonuclease